MQHARSYTTHWNTCTLKPTVSLISYGQFSHETTTINQAQY